MIRELIKKRIEELGVTAKSVAMELDFNYNSFNNYLQGRRNLPYEYLEKLLIKLDLLKA